MRNPVNTTQESLAPRLAGAIETYANHLRARNLSVRTLETNCERLKLFEQYLASRRLDLHDITRFVVEDYLVHLRERPHLQVRKRPRRKLSEVTVASTYATLHAFCAFAKKAKLIRSDFMDGVEAPRIPTLPPIMVPEETIRLVFDALNPKRPPRNYQPSKWRFVALRNRAILAVLYDSMLRASELRSLLVEDLDFADGMILVQRGKGAKARRVPFGFETMRVVRQWLDERATRTFRPRMGKGFRLSADRGPVFVDFFGRSLTKAALRSIFMMMQAQVGFDGRFFPHAIRHSAAKSAVRSGVDLFSLSRILGHATLTVTRRYAQLDDAEIARQHRLWSPVSRILRR